MAYVHSNGFPRPSPKRAEITYMDNHTLGKEEHQDIPRTAAHRIWVDIDFQRPKSYGPPVRKGACGVLDMIWYSFSHPQVHNWFDILGSRCNHHVDSVVCGVKAAIEKISDLSLNLCSPPAKIVNQTNYAFWMGWLRLVSYLKHLRDAGGGPHHISI